MDNSEKIHAAQLSILSNTLLIAIKVIAGILMQSVSVISEAVHSGIDLTAAVIAWIAVKESNKPADEDHNFGHGKIENVAGTIEAGLISVAAVWIIWEAINKLIKGTGEIENLRIGIIIMGISALSNYLVSRHLFKIAVKTDSIALRADSFHLRTDVYTSIAVLAGLAAIKLTGLSILDPLVAIGVAGLILKAAYDLTKCAFLPILDIKLPDDEEAIIHEVMKKHSEHFLEYHKLRTRKSGHIRHIDMHLVVPKHMTVEMGHNLSHQISADIEKRLKYSHVLIHIEP